MTTAAARAILDPDRPRSTPSTVRVSSRRCGKRSATTSKAATSWNELLDRDQWMECDLAPFVLRWLQDRPEERRPLHG